MSQNLESTLQQIRTLYNSKVTPTNKQDITVSKVDNNRSPVVSVDSFFDGTNDFDEIDIAGESNNNNININPVTSADIAKTLAIAQKNIDLDNELDNMTEPSIDEPNAGGYFYRSMSSMSSMIVNPGDSREFNVVDNEVNIEDNIKNHIDKSVNDTDWSLLSNASENSENDIEKLNNALKHHEERVNKHSEKTQANDGFQPYLKLLQKRIVKKQDKQKQEISIETVTNPKLVWVEQTDSISDDMNDNNGFNEDMSVEALLQDCLNTDRKLLDKIDTMDNKLKSLLRDSIKW